MGKFNLKFVKPVASLAIGAAVLTGSFAVTGAADTAFAKAATVKVSKGKLVSAKSGKAVKGYKSYKGVLYKNGKKFTGLYKNTYYKSGKKGTGLYKNVYYKAGKKGSGWVGSGSSKKWYQDGKLLTGLGKNSGKLFIKGKYANGIQTYKGVEKLYKDGVVVKTVVDAAKAINNTTVEVTFDSAQNAKDISAGRFKIEGLEVTNASVKQTDSKVIILTTSAQEGGKKYTVALDGVKSRTFVGASDVQATGLSAVKFAPYTTSQQGIIGKEVTIKAQVAVAEGKSKAGIAVTFNVTNGGDTSTGNLGQKFTAEAFTDANGVATYSYTQYVAGLNDKVEAYPTGNTTLRADVAKVYWGNDLRLSVTDVTTDTTLANNAKKVYKIKSAENAGKQVNVTFAENFEVTPDKIVRGASVIDAVSGAKLAPYQVISGGQQAVKVQLNASGEGTFTVSGENASVTPVVFADSNVNAVNAIVGNERLETAELQATASTVKFENKQTIALTNEAQGVQYAAKSNVVIGAKYSSNYGGRQYVATLTDLSGNKAPKGTPVKVVIKDATSKVALHVFDVDGNQVPVDTNGVYSLVTDKDGVAKYTVVSTTNDGYATPIAFVDNGSNTANGKLDAADTQKESTITYFGDAVVSKATLKFFDGAKEVTQLKSGQDLTVKYQTVDQNGFPYAPAAHSNNKVTFQFTTTFGTLSLGVTDTSGKTVVIGNTNNAVEMTLDANGAIQFTANSNNDSTVNINASSSNSIIGFVDGTFKFVGSITALDNVNNATSVDSILKALLDDEDYKEQLDLLSSADQLKVAKAILDNRGSGYTQTRLDTEFATVYKPLIAAENLKVATAAVDKAEASNSKADLDAAQKLVTALPTGAAKDGLQTRLDAVKNIIDVTAEAGKVANTLAASGAVGTVKLPTVAAGYTIAVKTTSDDTKYDLNGKIVAAGPSNVVYTVTHTASGKTADTASVAVTVTVTP
ncbi:toxin-antitoxin system YwqK family antitoxin [Viridibacillus arvi]|uniref:hypothetical protein n=1 Tax=Viridibacillus arvi TaxID=263475 RepID=UPI003800F2CC